eukprot:SAG22_NODE_53_length_24242_cov_158.884231_4_plen_96_part_00
MTTSAANHAAIYPTTPPKKPKKHQKSEAQEKNWVSFDEYKDRASEIMPTCLEARPLATVTPIRCRQCFRNPMAVKWKSSLLRPRRPEWGATLDQK